jgi:hypothetical protein
MFTVVVFSPPPPPSFIIVINNIYLYSASNLQIKLINVNTFAKLASECINTFQLKHSHKLVDMDRVVRECVKIIGEQLPMYTDHNYRVPPLVLRRFARGGKTETLSGVFDVLKKEYPNIHPIMISFNGNAPNAFKRRAGETQSEAILRLIALQLGDYTREESINLVVDRNSLDKHIGENVVLLIRA